MAGETTDITAIASIVSGIGTTGLALVVWWEQRSINRGIQDLRLLVAAMLGPEKVRRIKRPDGRPLTPPPGILIENDRDSE